MPPLWIFHGSLFWFSQVIAEDLDGPSYSHVRYSIVDGNQGSPFTIDSARGELRVARQLDRERVRETADYNADCTQRVWSNEQLIALRAESNHSYVRLKREACLHYCVQKQLFFFLFLRLQGTPWRW